MRSGSPCWSRPAKGQLRAADACSDTRARRASCRPGGGRPSSSPERPCPGSVMRGGFFHPSTCTYYLPINQSTALWRAKERRKESNKPKRSIPPSKILRGPCLSSSHPSRVWVVFFLSFFYLPALGHRWSTLNRDRSVCCTRMNLLLTGAALVLLAHVDNMLIPCVSQTNPALIRDRLRSSGHLSVSPALTACTRRLHGERLGVSHLHAALRGPHPRVRRLHRSSSVLRILSHEIHRQRLPSVSTSTASQPHPVARGGLGAS